MPRKSAAPKRKRRKDTPAAQHKRFLKMAEEIGASKDPKDFERAFRKVARVKTSPT
jgi:hypothetical protein